MTLAPRTGGQILVDQLVAQGVKHAFCVPGESYLAVLDALHDSNVEITVCRQEGGAAMMADAAGRLTGRPGICFVTRGPGATNASAGIHIAEHDSVPMILFVGQIERGMRGRGAFQEMDYRAAFGPIAKWATEIDDAARIPEIVSRAFHVAMQGRPGPVVIGLPEDMLVETASVADASYVMPALAGVATQDADAIARMLGEAKRPMLIVGGGGWTPDAREDLRAFVEAWDLPVAASFRRQMLIDGEHPNYAGEIGIGPNPKLRARIEASDLLILLNARMSEMPSQSYQLLGVPVAKQKLIHIHPDPNEIGRVYAPTLGVVASAPTFAADMAKRNPDAKPAWSGETRAAREDFLAWTGQAPVTPGAVQMGEIVQFLRRRLPEDFIATNGAGNYAIWHQRFLRFRQFGSQLAPTSGSMGYGVPAAIGAKRVAPHRTVVAFSGDGCFLMHGQEFATAVQYDLPVIFVIVDNSMYGTIRMHQEREYPGRVSGTQLRNPDFAAYARAFGGHGESVLKTEEFEPAFERAVASGKPAILHLKIDPEAITPTTTLTKIREQALAAGK
jgi:acetolactate synthase-1/2/3 large subunit